ncbi:DUF305 domain-containing protein [Methylobacterium sp. sgz302541]|uniref:DUF305 domain-containing protein n=1 Tax=unclassified Methylobacterium TaxID=2615210 RepID=UPI003D33FFDC
MAKVAMRHADDPWSRQRAWSIIVEQQRKIAEMQAWLARHGASIPPGGQPRHIMNAVPAAPSSRNRARRPRRRATHGRRDRASARLAPGARGRGPVAAVFRARPAQTRRSHRSDPRRDPERVEGGD